MSGRAEIGLLGATVLLLITFYSLANIHTYLDRLRQVITNTTQSCQSRDYYIIISNVITQQAAQVILEYQYDHTV